MIPAALTVFAARPARAASMTDDDGMPAPAS